MIQIAVENNFECWRKAARPLVQQAIHPESIMWTSQNQGSLFQCNVEPSVSKNEFLVPAEFITLARAVACYDGNEKWPLLYCILFRIVFENRQLLEIDSDADVRRARLMEKAVNRDVHKFHAFVRFRRIDCDSGEIFGAWHEPQHNTVERAAPFFARRFGSMMFSIFTPKGCAHWDTKKLTFSQPVDKSFAPDSDKEEDLWLLYYRSIFNPFRLKVKAMKREFPVRHWSTLPEASLIAELIEQGKKAYQDEVLEPSVRQK